MSDATVTAGTDGEFNIKRTHTEVKILISDILNIDATEVDEGMRMLDLPGVDSLKLMQGLLAVEEHFGITLDEERALAVRTVGEIATLVDLAIGNTAV